MANKTRQLNRVERQKSLLADFNEFNNISSFDELVKVIQSPYEFARMYRAANAKMMLEAIPEYTASCETCSEKSWYREDLLQYNRRDQQQ